MRMGFCAAAGSARPQSRSRAVSCRYRFMTPPLEFCAIRKTLLYYGKSVERRGERCQCCAAANGGCEGLLRERAFELRRVEADQELAADLHDRALDRAGVLLQ